MMHLVSVSPQGQLRRYLCRKGDKPFLTHEAEIDTGAATEPVGVIVESFRTHPPFCFATAYTGSLGPSSSPSGGMAA